MKITCAMLGALAAFTAHATVTVSGVAFTQDAATHDVTVTYDLDTSDNEPAFVSLDVLTNGVSVGATRVKTLSGDVSDNPANTASLVVPGSGKSITWRARADLPGLGLSDAAVRVTAIATNHFEGLYLVVDLSRGKDSTYWPVQYTACKPDTNSPAFYTTELWLRRVPAGTFTMGYGTSAGTYAHSVTLSHDYYCGVVPVTRAQYLHIRAKNTYDDYWPDDKDIGELDDNGYPYGWRPLSKDMSYNELRGSGWPDTAAPTASSFTGKLRTKTGLDFDLPTEAQWEYACRAGYPGNTFNDGTPYSQDGYVSLGWGQKNSGWTSGTNPAWIHPVARLKANDWDFYDFYGNVLEWSRDWFENFTSSTGAVTDPTGPSSGSYRTARGGFYGQHGGGLNSYYRRHDVASTSHDDRFGYRLVVETDEGDAAATAQGAQRGSADSATDFLETRPAATLAGVRYGSAESYIDTASNLAFVLTIR